MISKSPTAYIIRLTLALAVAGFAPHAIACDTDADCGSGGTCIKREKRARGVCYGGGASRTDAPEPAPNPHPTETPILAPQDRSSMSPSGDAPIFGEEGYIEPSAAPSIIDRLDVPERSQGACITSTDCAGGQECIYRDPMLGHGICDTPPN